MTENDHTAHAAALGFVVRNAPKMGANGLVSYACVDGDYVTGPVAPGSRVAKEAMRQHFDAKHRLPPG